jgi:hypothetical protein
MARRNSIERETFEVTTSTYPLRTLGKYNWNNKFWNMVSTYVVKVMFLIGNPFTISRCRSRYEADLAVSVKSFISRSIGKCSRF